jgi:hypothetical protein
MPVRAQSVIIQVQAQVRRRLPRSLVRWVRGA